MNNQLFDSGFMYGFIFAQVAATPAKCKHCGEYPEIWNYKNNWRVDCDCGNRVSDMLIITAIDNWNKFYGDGSNYSIIIDICNLNASSSNNLDKQMQKCCCDR